jgi:hypothetical protein
MDKDELKNILASIARKIDEATDSEQVSNLVASYIKLSKELGDKEIQPLWDVKQHTEYLGIEPETLQKWCNQKKSHT